MATNYNSTFANTIPQIWDTKLLAARYAKSVVLPRVLNKSDLVKGKGAIVSINIEPTLSTGTITAATGAFTPANTTPTLANITADTWVYVSAEDTLQAQAQSFFTSDNLFPEAAGKAMAEAYDTALLALYTGVASGYTTGSTDAPGLFDDVMARAAMLKLADAKVPLDNLSWFLSPSAVYAGWMAKTELTAAHFTGLPKSVNTTGYMTPLLGVPAYQSTLVATSGSARANILAHKEAIGCVMQKDHEYFHENAIGAGYAKWVNFVHSLYGVAVVRSNHFFVAYAK